MVIKQELLDLLQKINEECGGDPEECHGKKDGALLEYINDEAITDEFNKGTMWYA